MFVISLNTVQKCDKKLLLYLIVSLFLFWKCNSPLFLFLLAKKTLESFPSQVLSCILQQSRSETKILLAFEVVPLHQSQRKKIMHNLHTFAHGCRRPITCFT